MNGLIVLDKPKGITSFGLVARVKKIVGGKKVGHTGTLDPDATGVMIILLGKATRLARFFESDTKMYRAEITLGITTDTLDASGKVLNESPASDVSLADLKSVLTRFNGVITQRVPIFSAVKLAGRPLYKMARSGIRPEAPLREVEIFSLKLISFAPGPNPKLTIDVTCSKGTYIRALAADIGESLGVGAHLSSLVRLRSGKFSMDKAITLSDLETLSSEGRLCEVIISIREALDTTKTLSIQKHDEEKIICGNSILLADPIHLAQGEDVLLLGSGGEAIAVAKSDNDDKGATTLRPYIVLGEAG